jgi:hypothetical protein
MAGRLLQWFIGVSEIEHSENAMAVDLMELKLKLWGRGETRFLPTQSR